MGHANANYFSKTYIVCCRKSQKIKEINKNFTVSFPGKTPLKTHFDCITPLCPFIGIQRFEISRSHKETFDFHTGRGCSVVVL